ncbi:hypothetical protein RYH80_06985 [Halobaculum sp. MBLA0147]|uniref:hypothetical protein n=1 Tax=Halobaculum sp. MBLA0147 TaxID=3079934 RepID=UPI003525BEB3
MFRLVIAKVTDSLTTGWLRGGTTDEDDVERSIRRLKSALFSDDLGLLVFLTSVLFFTLVLRLSVSINDSYAVSNTLLAVSDGTVFLTDFVLGPESGAQPGISRTETRLVGRNYGQVFLTLPVYLLLSGLSLVFELHAVLLGMWALLLYATLIVAARYTGVGSAPKVGILTIGVLVANVAVATPVSERLTSYISLQLTTMIAAGFIGVVLYKLFRRELGDRTAAMVGLLGTIGTPIGFFSTIPKRHTFSALFLLLAMFTLYRSGVVENDHRRHVYKMCAYATVGAMTWIHAPEGFILLISVGIADLTTPGSLRPKDIAFSATGLCLSLVPFFLTNTLISGNPLQPPRLLEGYKGEGLEAPPEPGTGGEPGNGTPKGGTPGDGESEGGTPGPPGGEDPSSPGTGIVERFRSVLLGVTSLVYRLVLTTVELGEKVLSMVGSLAEIVVGRIGSSLSIVYDGDRLWKLFGRRGFMESVPVGKHRPVNLSLTESMPALGLLVGIVSHGTRTGRTDLRRWRHSPYFPADMAAVVYSGLLLLLALPSLPIHTSLTVRYLHPLYAVGLYAVVRLPLGRSLLKEYPRHLWHSYLVSVAVFTAVSTILVPQLVTVPGEAVQLYASVAFGLAVALTLFTAGVSFRRSRRGTIAIAILTGSAFGLVTTYLVCVSLVVFGPEPNAVPIVEELSKVVGL